MSEIETLPPCPHCGEVTGVYFNKHVRGFYAHSTNERGEIDYTDFEGISPVKITRIRCSNCAKIRRDLAYEPSGVTTVKSIS